MTNKTTITQAEFYEKVEDMMEKNMIRWLFDERSDPSPVCPSIINKMTIESETILKQQYDIK